MSDQAKQRIEAIGKQLSPGIAAIKKIAGPSNGPRVMGKVVIITGADDLLPSRIHPYPYSYASSPNTE